MARSASILTALAALIAAIPVEVVAQIRFADSAGPATDFTGATEPNPLPGLPRPPDQPASLLKPAPAAPVYGCPQLECPYFEPDPLLDPAELAQPGWLFDFELGVIGSHVVNHLGETASPIAGVVPVPMAALDWTATPRFELGYRLPSGFGELDAAYRFLLADGTGSSPAGSTASPDATAELKSSLNINVADLDYASRETSLGPNWGMKWRIGLRTADVYFDSHADESLAAASAGSGIFERTIQDSFWGIGPHAALELDRRRNSWGVGCVGRLDGGLLFGEVRQKFVQISTTPGPIAVTEFRNPQQVPMLSGFLGFDWRPPSRQSLDILLGYTAEYWWNVGRLSDPDIYNGLSAGEVGTNGAVLRLEYNY